MAVAVHRFVCTDLGWAFSDVIDESFKISQGLFQKLFGLRIFRTLTR